MLSGKLDAFPESFIRDKEMSYDVSAHHAAETFLKNRLNALQEPTMGINHGRNAPLNLTDDKKAHSPDQQLVEFTFLMAWEPCVARFNRALGIKADDVSGNGYCLAPVAR